MQADVPAFIVEDMNFYLGRDGAFRNFQVCPDDVVGLAGRNPLRELSAVIGSELPLGFFFVGAAYLDSDSISGAVIGTIDRTEDQRIGLFFRLVFARLTLPARQ